MDQCAKRFGNYDFEFMNFVDEAFAFPSKLKFTYVFKTPSGSPEEFVGSSLDMAMLTPICANKNFHRHHQHNKPKDEFFHLARYEMLSLIN